LLQLTFRLHKSQDLGFCRPRLEAGYSVRQQIQTGSASHSTSYPVSTAVSSLVKRPSVKLTTCMGQLLRLRTHRDLSSPLHIFKSRCGGGLEYLHRSPCRAVEGGESDSGVRGYNWATLSLGDINTETRSSRLGVGRKADNLAL
jgi:hypothetical protein